MAKKKVVKRSSKKKTVKRKPFKKKTSKSKTVKKKKAVKKKRAAKKKKRAAKKKDDDLEYIPEVATETRSTTMLGVPSGEHIKEAKVIETGVDKLVSLIKARHRVSVKEATKELGIAKDVVDEWADFLESEGIVFIEHSFLATYLIDREFSKEARTQLKGEVDKQAMIISRKLEGSIGGLQRDAEEIRLVKNEFENLHDYVKANFEKLHEEFNALSEFHDAYSAIRDKKRNLTKGYAGKLADVDDRLTAGQKEYRFTLKSLNDKLKTLRDERQKIDDLKATESKISDKIVELKNVLQDIKARTADEVIRLRKTESELSKDEKRLLSIKGTVQDEGRDLNKIFSELGKARINLQDAEKTFMQKVSKISELKIPKKDVIQKGSAIVNKITNFLAEASDIRQDLKQLETDRLELAKAYDKLVKKTLALSVSAKKGEVPMFRWEALDKERESTDRARTKLSSHLVKLRKRVRKLVK